jgi:hypothetical protein|nr:MAG TPA: AAA domain protein [Caudoviricetes sp.]
MNLMIINFGGLDKAGIQLDEKRFVMPNGSGKTTIVNAFHWLFTGKTIAGFEPIRDACKTVVVKLTGMPFYGGNVSVIERRLNPDTGTSTLLVNGMVYTQTEFEADLLRETGVSIDLVRACATPTVLTYQSLTTDDLQKMLVSVGALNGDELKELKAKQKRIREAMTRAENNSMLSVEVPEVTTEVTTEELTFLKEYKDAKDRIDAEDMIDDIPQFCPCCGQMLPLDIIKRRRERYNRDVLFVNENEERAQKTQIKVDKHNEEVLSKRDAERMIEIAKEARKDYEDYKKYLDEVTKQIQEAQETYVGAQLPPDVELITEERLKNGKTKPCCKLTYKGLPLKTINYAKRVEICVQLIDTARRCAGAEHTIPILLDNAESVEGLQDIENLIRFEVPPYEEIHKCRYPKSAKP